MVSGSFFGGLIDLFIILIASVISVVLHLFMHQSPGSASGNISKIETPYWVCGIYQRVWTIVGLHCIGMLEGVAGVLNQEYEIMTC